MLRPRQAGGYLRQSILPINVSIPICSPRYRALYQTRVNNIIKLTEPQEKYLFISISGIARVTRPYKRNVYMMERSMGKWLVYGCLLRRNKITTRNLFAKGMIMTNANMCTVCAVNAWRSRQSFARFSNQNIVRIISRYDYYYPLFDGLSFRTEFAFCPSFCHPAHKRDAISVEIMPSTSHSLNE